MAKRHLLIGGTHGISEKLQERLEKRGDEVITVARGGDATFQADVTKEFPDLEGEFDGLIYCPGTVNLKPFHQMTEDDYRNDLEINFLGGVRVVKHVVKHMAKGSSIVMFSTVAVQLGMPYHTSIAAAKGAVAGFVRSLAAELAPKVRVNAIAPSLTETPLTEKLVDSEAKREMSAKRHPLGRIGRPDDIAAVAAFLLSDDAGWVTGQVIGVDGGLSSLRML